MFTKVKFYIFDKTFPIKKEKARLKNGLSGLQNSIYYNACTTLTLSPLNIIWNLSQSQKKMWWHSQDIKLVLKFFWRFLCCIVWIVERPESNKKLNLWNLKNLNCVVICESKAQSYKTFRRLFRRLGQSN